MYGFFVLIFHFLLDLYCEEDDSDNNYHNNNQYFFRKHLDANSL